MDAEQFKEMMTRIDLIIRLLALDIVKGMETQTDKILALSSSGFGPKDIARLLGTTANTVRVTLSKAKKKAGTTREMEESVGRQTVQSDSA